MQNITQSWHTIKNWLEKQVPDLIEVLQPPVSLQQLEQAEKQMHLSFPQEFKTLYQQVNGNHPEKASLGFLPSEEEWDEMAYDMLALEQVIAIWQQQKELLEGGDFQEGWWDITWIPFASNGAGDYYCIDKNGQVILHMHETGEYQIIAESLGVYFGELADGFEDGEFVYDEEWGVCGKE